MQLPKTYNEAVMLATVIESEVSRGRVHDITPNNVKVREMGRPRYNGKTPTVRPISEKRFQPRRPDSGYRRPDPGYRKPRTTVHNLNTRDTEQRRCFRCQQIGHLIRNCPQKPNSDKRVPTGQSLNSKRGPETAGQ